MSLYFYCSLKIAILFRFLLKKLLWKWNAFIQRYLLTAVRNWKGANITNYDQNVIFREVQLKLLDISTQSCNSKKTQSMSQIKTHKCHWLDRTLDIRFLKLFTFFPEIEWNYEVSKLIFPGKPFWHLRQDVVHLSGRHRQHGSARHELGPRDRRLPQRGRCQVTKA